MGTPSPTFNSLKINERKGKATPNKEFFFLEKKKTTSDINGKIKRIPLHQYILLKDHSGEKIKKRQRKRKKKDILSKDNQDFPVASKRVEIAQFDVQQNQSNYYQSIHMVMALH